MTIEMAALDAVLVSSVGATSSALQNQSASPREGKPRRHLPPTETAQDEAFEEDPDSSTHRIDSVA
jgi:hypothetical protein